MSKRVLHAAHFLGATVLEIDEEVFLIDLRHFREEMDGEAAKAAATKWQLALSFYSVENTELDVLPCISIEPVLLYSAPSRGDKIYNLNMPHSPLGYFFDASIGKLDSNLYERDMDNAIEFFSLVKKGNVSLRFQPIADSVSAGQVLYHEALLSVSVPNQNAGLTTAKIICSLERLGLIRLLDYLVVNAVIQKLVADDQVRLGCNVSALSLVSDVWWSPIFNILVASPSVAKRLTIEVTETRPLPSIPDAIRLVNSLQRMGCKVALDDFGGGYASLGFAMKVAPDLIKLGIDSLRLGKKNARHDLRFTALIKLCKALAPLVVVEGVEADGDVVFLAAKGCQWMQGFHIYTENVFDNIPILLPAVAYVGSHVDRMQ